MLETLAKRIHEQMPRYIETLESLIRIPSISFDNFDPNEVLRSADAVKKLFEKNGLQNVKFLTPPSGHSAVYAELRTKPGHPTILLYAHHDVQPTMREDLWDSPPFAPEIRDGRLYGRGAADDKAGIVLHLAAVTQALALYGDKMPNVKFIIEGEEEAGSSGMETLLQNNRELLQCDAVIIADLSNFARGTPSITTTLRGMSAISIVLKAVKTPLHSGSWSGPIPDPAQALCKMIASLTDAEGHILISHFEDPTVPPTAEELASYEALGMTEEKFREQAGVLPGVKLLAGGSDILKSLWRRASIVVTAMESGLRTQAGNVLQNSAYARIGIRLAPGMDADVATLQLIDALKKSCPFGLELSIFTEDGANPFTTDTSHPYFEKMKQAMTETYGTPAKYIGCGASIPGAQLFRDTFGNVPILLTGLEDPACNAHSENESLALDDFEHGIAAEAAFFGSLVK